uniref:ZP domain-containing protein n=1 Tax=Plectus sambesii TaxID=2011161 RepID=A0A914VKU3_9BILA
MSGAERHGEGTDRATRRSRAAINSAGRHAPGANRRRAALAPEATGHRLTTRDGGSRKPAAPMGPIWAILALLISVGDGFAIDNEVIGTPQIHCSENAITFSVRTRNIFRGNIYIKGQYGVPQCRQEYFSNDYAGASYSVRIGECAMRRIRQLQPHGMNYMLVFVTNFHPQFVTKVDRAYNVRCFYAQADKTVSSQLEVSMLNTESLEQSTMLMPNCAYTVRSGQVNGPLVRYAKVGDQLVHRWECDNPNFGMLVKNCFVSDGGGASQRVLDARGCPVFTAVVLGNLQYDNSLNLAYVPVWAYKFPDRSQLYFQCQIQICNKRDNECVGVTPPNCPLVTKSEFEPTSQINPNVNPNQVIGTFLPGTPVVGGQIDAGGVYPINPAVVGQPNTYIGQPYAAAASQEESRQTYEGRGVAPQIDPNTYVPPEGTRSSFALPPGTEATFPAENIDPNSYGPIPTGLQPARPFSQRRKDTPPADDRNSTDSNASTSTNQQQTRAVTRARTHRRVVRSPNDIDILRWKPAKEAGVGSHKQVDPVEKDKTAADDPTADETMDVVAEPVFIADPEQDVDDSPEFTNAPFSTKRDYTANHAVCLNQLGLALLMSTFVVMAILLCALLFYVFNQQSKKQRAAGGGSLLTAPLRSYASSSTNISRLSTVSSSPPELRPLPGKEAKKTLNQWSFNSRNRLPSLVDSTHTAPSC